MTSAATGRRGAPRADGARFVMGTILRVAVRAAAPGEPARIRDDIFAEIQRLEAMLSFHRPDSELSRINRAAGEAPARVGPETYDAAALALRFAELCGGSFDPTARDYRRVRLNPGARSVFLPDAGMRLDLGGIGKGFALDRALRSVREAPGLESISADFGGQLLFWAPSGSFEPVKVAIENPRENGAFLAAFEVRSNCSVSTSSQGERPGHLRDPRTGLPARGAESVTVVAPTAAEAEAWSTALFVDAAASSAFEDRPGVEAFVFARGEDGALFERRFHSRVSLI